MKTRALRVSTRRLIGFGASRSIRCRRPTLLCVRRQRFKRDDNDHDETRYFCVTKVTPRMRICARTRQLGCLCRSRPPVPALALCHAPPSTHASTVHGLTTPRATCQKLKC